MWLVLMKWTILIDHADIVDFDDMDNADDIDDKYHTYIVEAVDAVGVDDSDVPTLLIIPVKLICQKQ